LNWASLGFDLVLAISLIGLSGYGLRTQDLFSGVVLFIVFGLLMALAWVRLHAPDLALAEAAIGSGLTGALFLAALARMESQTGELSPDQRGLPAPPGFRHAVALLATALGAVLVWSLWHLPGRALGLGPTVRSRIGETGVENPVTAVILNFRSYDTLLEIGVLLLAVVSVHAVYARSGVTRRTSHVTRGASPVLLAFVRLLTPLMVLVAGYLIWVGAHAPGGAFQGGALVGGLGVVLLLAGGRLTLDLEGNVIRIFLVIGFAVFLMVGVAVMVEGHFLEYPREAAKTLILVIEVVSAVSIGLILAALFAACAGLAETGTGGGGAEQG